MERSRRSLVPWIAAGLVAIGAISVYRAQLFTVSRPGEAPRPLQLLPDAERHPASFDVILPVIPVGMRRLQSHGGPMLIHYWAPWERHGGLQATLLDSLQRSPELRGLVTTLVCFDPFPSVARFVARRKLRLGVLLDRERHLRAALPCPSVPYTYVIDAAGRVVIAQAGEVDWWSEETRRSLAEAMRVGEVKHAIPGAS